MKNITFKVVFFLFSFLFAAGVSLSSVRDVFAYEGTLQNPLAPNLSPKSGESGVELFNSGIQTLVGTLLIAAAVIFFIMFLIGAISWITSSGDKAKVEAARGTIMNAVIGLVIAFSLFAVLKLIETLFGVHVLQIDVGALRIK